MRASLSFTRGVFDHSQSESVTIIVLFHIAHIIAIQSLTARARQGVLKRMPTEL
jgi:hypothetical protein